MKMELGTVVFEYNPSELSDIIVKEKHSASVDTYDSVAYFSWGTRLVGREITIKWDAMTPSQFDALQELYEADVPVPFRIKNDTCDTATVEITKLTGTYMVSMTGEDVWRKGVSMSLLFISEVY
jgi:hypothetical protein